MCKSLVVLINISLRSKMAKVVGYLYEMTEEEFLLLVGGLVQSIFFKWWYKNHIHVQM